MASQIAHIIYAQKYLEKHPMPNGDEDLFLLGCVFPDIRRIDESIKRKDTHLCYENCDLNLEGLTPFEKGWKFHLYCDMKREEILNKYDFYAIRGTLGFEGVANKLLEDEILYDTFNNWEKVVSFFNNPPQIDTGLPIKPEAMQFWYAINAKYFETKPTDKTMRILASKVLSPEKAKEIVKEVDKLRKNEKVTELLLKVRDEII